jgi:hypothetical protein
MITAIRATARTPPRKQARGEVLSADAPAASRALVAIAPVLKLDVTPRPSQRAAAPFLAQLIATQRMFPQTRNRNRAEPSEAIAAYDDVARRLRRSGH